MDERRLLDNDGQLRGLYIPSSVASRVGSPLANFLDTENLKGFKFSFIDSKYDAFEPEPSETFLRTPTSDTLYSNPTNIMTELEILRSQITQINKRLGENLESLREKEEKHAHLIKMVEKKSNSLRATTERSMRTEIDCSCSKGCEIY